MSKEINSIKKFIKNIFLHLLYPYQLDPINANVLNVTIQLFAYTRSWRQDVKDYDHDGPGVTKPHGLIKAARLWCAPVGRLCAVGSNLLRHFRL